MDKAYMGQLVSVQHQVIQQFFVVFVITPIYSGDLNSKLQQGLEYQTSSEFQW